MLAVLSTKNTSACTGTLGNQVLGLEQNMNSQGKLLERERKLRLDGEEGHGACPVYCPFSNWPVSLTKQPGGSSSSGSLHPHLQLRNPYSLRVSCLSGWRPGHFSLRHNSGSRRRRQSKRKGREGQRGGCRGEGEGRHWTLPELGLIYFINRDYKFNLQTRGQNFSLTRGPGRTSGLGDHSYYWLHISICLWCSMSAFLPPSPPTIFLAGRLILIVAIEQSIVCL